MSFLETENRYKLFLLRRFTLVDITSSINIFEVFFQLPAGVTFAGATDALLFGAGVRVTAGAVGAGLGAVVTFGAVGEKRIRFLQLMQYLC